MKQTLLTICLILFALPSWSQNGLFICFFDNEIDLCIYATDKDFIDGKWKRIWANNHCSREAKNLSLDCTNLPLGITGKGKLNEWKCISGQRIGDRCIVTRDDEV